MYLLKAGSFLIQINLNGGRRRGGVVFRVFIALLIKVLLKSVFNKCEKLRYTKQNVKLHFNGDETF